MLEINIELGVWGIAAQDRPPMTWLFISQTPVPRNFEKLDALGVERDLKKLGLSS